MPRPRPRASPKPRFNVGVDCEDISPWRKMLPRLHRGSARGLFTTGEHRYCRSFPDAAPHYAARWCAKEAVCKALSPWLRADLRAIEIENGPGGGPIARLSREIVARLGPYDVSVSLSHSRNTAMAAALVSPRGYGSGRRRG